MNLSLLPFPLEVLKRIQPSVMEPVTLSRTVQLIDFPYTKNLADKKVTAKGWGRTDLNKTAMTHTKLMNPLNDNVGTGKICFSGEGNCGVCFGDSGSPLLYVVDDKQYTVGVVSWSAPCPDAVPDVFIRVSYYADWINKTMEENSVNLI
ncbi:hypothetical protein RUM44_012120 [Polyplax serrata]|uniref:Peptidase S1 domain-containing protein n=1 Tax=Polyplax serrata TaxID=468196 RepID=A0ABR1BAE6_POLSC